jgi:hypothetical protein
VPKVIVTCLLQVNNSEMSGNNDAFFAKSVKTTLLSPFGDGLASQPHRWRASRAKGFSLAVRALAQALVRALAQASVLAQAAAELVAEAVCREGTVPRGDPFCGADRR